ncbi:hypothetical protein M9Y10_002340 [Tritrichomonas musculus]|uniref:Signal sequence receptor subunit gamma n=1 Tax=Tritrichomonas musculus TaxID=1915356 RepID=A0ABR2LB75_9EUKA
MSNRQQANTTPEDDESQFAEFKNVKRQSSGFLGSLKFLPFGLITSAIGVLLYVTVRGLDINLNIPYIVVGYAVAAICLTFSYQNVAKWVKKQRSIQLKGNYEGPEGLWFSLFYNNAFYVFLAFFFSHIVFSSIAAPTSLVLTQVCASALPAWISSLSN